MDDAQATSKLKSDYTWLQKHERLLLGAVLALVMVFGVCTVEKHMDASANLKVQILQAQLNTQKEQNAQNETHSAQIEAQYATMIEMFQKQNAALASAVTARNNGLIQQKGVDKNLPPTELALRWQGLIGGNTNDVVSSSSGFNISTGAAIATVSLLEEVPVLRADLVDETKIVDNKNAELGKADDVIAALNTQVSGLKTQITDEEKVSDAKITALERKSRLSKLRWFFAGVVAGFLGRGQI